jgi:hypothetical protein
LLTRLRRKILGSPISVRNLLHFSFTFPFFFFKTNIHLFLHYINNTLYNCCYVYLYFYAIRPIPCVWEGS